MARAPTVSIIGFAWGPTPNALPAAASSLCRWISILWERGDSRVACQSRHSKQPVAANHRRERSERWQRVGVGPTNEKMVTTKQPVGALRIAGMPRLRPSPFSATSLLALALAAGVLLIPSLDARQAVPAGMCRVDGKATSGGTPLPGVSLTFKAGDTAAGATSTEADGRYQVVIKQGIYHLTVTFSGFAPVERDLTLEGTACGQTIDFQLTLLARTARTTAAGPRPGPAAGGRGAAGSQPFEAIAVQQQAAGALVTETATEREAEETAARQLLPPGFSNETPSQAVTFTGNAASLDRGMLGERFEAMGRGEFDPATGEVPPGFGIPGGPGAFGGQGGFGGRGGPEDLEDQADVAVPEVRAARRTRRSGRPGRPR